MVEGSCQHLEIASRAGGMVVAMIGLSGWAKAQPLWQSGYLELAAGEAASDCLLAGVVANGEENMMVWEPETGVSFAG